MEVRNGLGTSFWFDVWSDMERLSDLVGDRGCIDMGISLSASVASVVQRRTRRHRCDIYTMIEEALHKQRGKMKTGNDVPLWKNSMDTFKPVFSTRNTWYLIRSSAPKVSWYESTWFPYSTPKYAFIAWLAMHNRLTTGD